MQAVDWPSLLHGCNAESRTAREDSNIFHYRWELEHKTIRSQQNISFLVGKPYFENIQYNSPIEIYDDNTVDEMVKIMNNGGVGGGANGAAGIGAGVGANGGGIGGKKEMEEEVEAESGATSNMGWSVKNVTTSNHVYKKDKPASWTNM